MHAFLLAAEGRNGLYMVEAGFSADHEEFHWRGQYPNLTRYMAVLEQRPSFVATRPKMMDVDLKRQCGDIPSRVHDGGDEFLVRSCKLARAGEECIPALAWHRVFQKLIEED